MKIKLLTHTPNLIETCWAGARTCYSSSTPSELFEKAMSEDKNKMVNFLVSLWGKKHFSIFEHNAFTFSIEGVSRTLMAQITRHRIGISFSIQSQRFLSEQSEKNGGQFEYVIPPSISENIVISDLYHRLMKTTQNTYDILIESGIKPEDARFVLGGGASTNMTMTVNLRSFGDLWNKRFLETHAQWEVREMVEKMRDEIVEVESWTERLFIK